MSVVCSIVSIHLILYSSKEIGKPRRKQVCWRGLEYADYIPCRELRPPLPKKKVLFKV